MVGLLLQQTNQSTHRRNKLIPWLWIIVEPNLQRWNLKSHLECLCSSLIIIIAHLISYCGKNDTTFSFLWEQMISLLERPNKDTRHQHKYHFPTLFFILFDRWYIFPFLFKHPSSILYTFQEWEYYQSIWFISNYIMYRVYGDTMCLLCGVGRGSNFITPGSSNNSIIVGPTKSISAVKYRVTGPTLIFYYLLLSFLLLSHYFDIMNLFWLCILSCPHEGRRW